MITKEKINRFLFDRKGWIPLLLLALFVLAFVYAPTMVSILIASFITADAIEPIVAFFSKKLKIPRTFTTILSIVLIALVVAVLLLAILPEIILQLSNVDMKPAMMSLWEFANSQAVRFDVNLSELVSQEELVSAIGTHAASLSTFLSKAISVIWTQTSSIISLILDALIFVVITFFVSSRFQAINRAIFSLIPPKIQPSAKDWILRFDKIFSGFIRGQLTVCIVLGSLYAVLFTVAGIKGGGNLGIMIGTLCFVPYVGLFTGISISLILALISGGAVGMFKVLIIFVIIQVCDTIFITPNIVGKKVNVNPVFVIIALFAGAEIGGFLGVLTAVPLFAMLKIVLDEVLKRYKASDFYNGEKPEVSSGDSAEK
ncbi:AI-2E family transporter [bacterium]|nr:AI-2E family transporter [bacterium]